MNELKQIEEFRKVLADYQPSSTARESLRGVKLVMFIGPTSSGKNTIIGELQQAGTYHFVISDTTRKPRDNQGVLEQNGREYWFRSEDELLKDLQDGAFLEAAIIHNQQVSGTSIRELVVASDNGQPALHEIDYVGAINVHDVKPDGYFFFIVPPSFDEWMIRMKGRGELPADETRRRLNSAVKEISTALEHDFFYFMVNDTYKHAAKHIDDIVQKDMKEEAAEAQSRESAKLLLDETTQYLKTIS